MSPGHASNPHPLSSPIVTPQHEMNSNKWIDLKNMVVCAEAGIVGQLSFTVIAVTSLSPIKPVMSV
eukprot:CAMPEP_0175919764 /NCGR_PEP_ID=MMETSP0108-20121206/12566_1 /TAXON_ID=195067 ORGANISM="Goniomonas pacifica, Strain CCMP1869" /NCGR_SAMPLE_ID=MMETSP0108 /ASSEMBLY_ACC=CAM_ASM_000204 /LENGTH=65 /DNA_ID=CAMNT_0017242429 /DNA_START=608 /DNA_END=805 /DNA_ORIENTATION=+